MSIFDELSKSNSWSANLILILVRILWKVLFFRDVENKLIIYQTGVLIIGLSNPPIWKVVGLNTILINNKRCLRGSKNPYKMSLKRYLMNRSTPVPVTFFVWWATFPGSGTQLFVISKETGSWPLPKPV